MYVGIEPVRVSGSMSRRRAWSRLPIRPTPPTSGPKASEYPTRNQRMVTKHSEAKLILSITRTCLVLTMPP